MLTRTVLAFAIALLCAAGAPAATFVVNTTVDGPDANPGDGVCRTAAGVCTFRAAIQEANVTTASDTIAFGIAGSGVHTLQTAGVPAASHPIVIDGFTQPGAQPNTNPNGGLNTVLKIELTGGLLLRGGSTTIRGVVAHGLRFEGPVPTNQLNRIEGCYIGTDATGTQDRSTGFGLLFSHTEASVYVGGNSPAQRNLVAGNDTVGIDMLCAANGLSCHGSSMIAGNLIGTDVSGAAPLPNGVGIRLFSSGGVQIGGLPSYRNVISGNTVSGIDATGANAGEVVRIEGNRIGVDDTGAIAVPNGTGISLGPSCVGHPSCQGPGWRSAAARTTRTSSPTMPGPGSAPAADWST